MLSDPLTNRLLPLPEAPPRARFAMLITCTNCATSYEMAANDLGPTGRSVRCARCQHMWFAANTEALAEIAEAHRADMAEFSASMVSSVPAAEPAPGSPEEPAFPPAEDSSLAQPEPTDQAGFEASPPPEAVTISDAPPLAPAGHTSAPPAAESGGEDIESAAARRAVRQAAQRRRWQQSSWTTALLVLIALNLALVGWRSDVVRWLPQTASLYAAIGLPVNLRGLVFTNVATEKETHDGVAVLLVEGTIVNAAKRAVEVPRLRFAIRNQDGHEIYSWTALPDRNALMPGEALPFRSRLASPPREGQQVLVRFFNRRDLVAGVQ